MFGRGAFMSVGGETEILLGAHPHTGAPRQFPHASDKSSQINERISARNRRWVRGRARHRAWLPV